MSSSSPNLNAPPTTYTTGGTPLPSSTKRTHPRLSLPLPLLRPSYHTVVIGSGYGGGVASSRLSRAGKSVCILELGHEKWPGEYPTSLLSAAPEVHISGNLGGSDTDHTIIDADKLPFHLGGDKTGLYHLTLGVGQNVFSATGLGGTSLLNANVFREMDRRTAMLPKWPEEIREEGRKDCLQKWYGRARDVLQPERMPVNMSVKKLELLELQAKRMGVHDKFERVEQTTTFEDRINSSGVRMKKSTLAGMDCTGVNDGSKNSVLMNYLADAWNWGAEIFCECEVRYIKPDPSGKGYIIYFAWHGHNVNRAEFERHFDQNLLWVRAEELCFLAAGSLGTTEILLRSQEHGMLVSKKLGTGMSGNGDILAFGYKTDEVANAIGRESRPPHLEPVGPTITGIIDLRDTASNVLDGFVLEEGAIPEALAPIFEILLKTTPGKLIDRVEELSVAERTRRLIDRTKNRLIGPEHIGPYVPGSAANRTQIYLVMSHDSNAATLTMDGDKPYLRFEGVAREKHLLAINEFLKNATHAVGGDLIFSPFYAWGQEQITVHPIGGANYSSDGTGMGGATNHLGEVFKGSGAEVHQGLVCVDGSVVPCALGVNPFATITALAERSVGLICERQGWGIDLTTRNGELDLLNSKPRMHRPLANDLEVAKAQIVDATRDGETGVRFAEVMEGWIHVGDGPPAADYTDAERRAKAAGSAARFFLSVDTYSTKNLVELEPHASIATGTFTCKALSPDPLRILQGGAQFFSNTDTHHLIYNFNLLTTDGITYAFSGYKPSSPSSPSSANWKAATTLHVTITRPIDDTTIARGVLKIVVRNFLDELKDFVYDIVHAAHRRPSTKERISDRLGRLRRRRSRSGTPVGLREDGAETRKS